MAEGERRWLRSPFESSSEPDQDPALCKRSDGLWDRGWRPWAQEAKVQVDILLPTAGVRIMLTGMLLITTSETGRYFSTNALAAVALSNTVYGCLCRLPLTGMAGSLDTFASQAVGAGRLDLLPGLFQRCLLFLAVNALPGAAVIALAPRVYRAMGQAPEVTQLVAVYMPPFFGLLVMEVLFRPLNKILIAQRITQPQLYCTMITFALHWPLTHLLMVTWGFGLVGGSAAVLIGQANTVLLLGAYVALSGRQATVWGRPTHTALQKWGAFAKLGYAAAAQDCTETFTWATMAVFAGLLPNGPAATASWAVWNQTYGIIFTPLLAQLVVAANRVGTNLGAGDSWQARCSALTVLAGVPVFWAVGAVAYLTPAVQRVVVRAFTDAGATDVRHHLVNLMRIGTVLLLPDGMQMTQAGTLQGMGKQVWGVWLNCVCQLCIGLPLAMLLGFRLGYGVEGLLTGLMLGVALQATAYLVILARVDWARLAASIAAAQQTAPEEGPEPA